jgi:hypothetical protein
MVIALVPFENSPKFNYVRKMSVVPAGYTGAMDGGGISTPLNHQFPRLNAARNSIFDAMRGDRTIMEEMGQPVEKKILSGLTRDMMEILLDENASDDTKANLYLNAINRYLTYTGKVNSLVPIATVRRKRAKPTPETVGISPQHIYNPIGKVKPTRDLFEKGGMFDDLVRPEFDKMASTSFHTPKREGGREGKDGRVGGPSPLPSHPPAGAEAASGSRGGYDDEEMWEPSLFDESPKSSRETSLHGDDKADSEDSDEGGSISSSSSDGEETPEKLFKRETISRREPAAFTIEDVIGDLHHSHKRRGKSVLKNILAHIPAKELAWSDTGMVILNGTELQVPIASLLQNNLNKSASKKDIAGSTAFDRILLKYRAANPSGVGIFGEETDKSGSGLVAPTIGQNKILYWET